MSDSLPQPGWYADPEDAASQRWWNGSGWSDQKRPVPPASFVPVPAPANGVRPDPYAPAAPTQPYYGGQQPYGARPAGSSVNGLALAGLITGAVGWLVIPIVAALAGLVLSILGLVQVPRREQAGLPGGRGLAIAGVIVSGLVLLLTILSMVAFFAALTAYR